jgi:hypothetical protein
VYDRNEAASLVGLSPITLTNYTRVGYSDLIRGLDYFVRSWQRGPYRRRKLFFTERGLRQLQLRAYRVFRPGPLSPSQRAFLKHMDATVRLHKKKDRPGHIAFSSNPLATNRRVRDILARVMREYLEHPCALPNCQCVTHTLGLPTIAELVEVGFFANHYRR